MRHTKTWTISLPPEMEREAMKLAKEERRTKSELVREALRHYLMTHELRLLQRMGVSRARAKGVYTEDDVQRVIDEFRAA